MDSKSGLQLEIQKIHANKNRFFDLGGMRNFSPEFQKLWRWIASDFKTNKAVNELAAQHWESQREMNETEEKLYTVGKMLVEISMENMPDLLPSVTTVLAIPRSGWAIGKGVADTLGKKLYMTNQGGMADASKPLLPTSLEPHSNVLLVDDILFQARTVRAALAQLRKEYPTISPTVIAAMVDKAYSRDLGVSVITAFSFISEF